MIHQADDVVFHCRAAIRPHLMRLLALTVSSAVERDDPILRESFVPSGKLPVVPCAGSEAMNQEDRIAAAQVLEMNLHAVGIKRRHSSLPPNIAPNLAVDVAVAMQSLHNRPSFPKREDSWPMRKNSDSSCRLTAACL